MSVQRGLCDGRQFHGGKTQLYSGHPPFIMQFVFCLLLQTTNRKCHIAYRIIPFVMTFNDFETQLLWDLQMYFVEYLCNISHALNWRSALHGLSAAAWVSCCIWYAECLPYFYFQFIWPTDLESVPYALLTAVIFFTKFEVCAIVCCRVIAFLLLICYKTFWPLTLVIHGGLCGQPYRQIGRSYKVMNGDTKYGKWCDFGFLPHRRHSRASAVLPCSRVHTTS